ncbi:pollen receptor-like kinase 2 [Vigna angularis]|nr:pollen receptor-like kinase 2 [Vigna angularis]
MECDVKFCISIISNSCLPRPFETDRPVWRACTAHPSLCVCQPCPFTMALSTSLTPFTFLLSSSFLSHILLVVTASDKELLLGFKDSIENKHALSSWNESVPPCSPKQPNWPYVQCYKGHVWGLTLENMRLKGVVDVQTLEKLPYLRTLSLKNNDFNTEWPYINGILGLKALFLSNNKFFGEVPSQAFQDMKWLKKIHLSNNRFTGHIPTSLASMPRLIELRLEGNQFTGSIPNFQRPLKSFSAADNKLEGQIPEGLRDLPISAFSGNEGLCGAPLEACPSKKLSLLSIIVTVVLVVVALVVIGAVVLLVLRRRRKRVPDVSEEDSPSMSHKKARSREPSEEGSHRSRSSSRISKGDTMMLSFVRDHKDQFDLHELLGASAEVLGSGCYSSSYKASLLSGPVMVVKRFKQMNNVGREEFQEHMRRFGRLNHPNLLPLIAYYYRKEEKLFVTDFVHNGSLAVRLHGYQALGQRSLEWGSRLKIVKGIAEGLQYLYREMPSLIAAHGHLKSSNVLLNESLEPLLTDYGLVPVINQDLAPDIMVIYKSPEYLQHGRITKKTDVWSLGIIILEILTGNLPVNFLQGKGSDLSLANWVHSVSEECSSEVFDKDMEVSTNSEGEMIKLLKIALACCERDVDKRWDLKEVVDRIHQVNETDNEDHNSRSSSNASEVEIRQTQSGEVSFSIDMA